MPRGPLGFPRVTLLGPLVKPSTILPFKDIEEGTYSISDLDSIQPLTGEDTRRALRDIFEYDLQEDSNVVNEVQFAYRKETMSNLMNMNKFSTSLLKAMSNAEEAGIPLEAQDTDMRGARNERLEEEVRTHMDGGDSIFTDKMLSGIDNTWERINSGNISSFEDESELRQRIVTKVVEDFDGVTDINDKIRSSKEYFPPTTEKVSLKGALGWGTIDGAHRLVALSQILGVDEKVYIWEWSNQEKFMEVN